MTTASAHSPFFRHFVKIGVFCLLIASVADALIPPRARSTALRLSSEVAVEANGATSTPSDSNKSSSIATDKFVKPPRLVPDDPSLIPTLYNYDHCPFCVRVRLALGFKNIKHNLIFMANDDIHTPTSLVGKKIAPIMVRKNNIFQRKTVSSADILILYVRINMLPHLLVVLTRCYRLCRHFSLLFLSIKSCICSVVQPTQEFPSGGPDAEDLIMMESMDIIAFIENDERFGPTNVLKPASGRTDLKAWQNSVKLMLRTLQRPRYVATGLLPEFQQIDSRHAFIAKHPLPPFDKPEWREMEDFSEKLSVYAEAMASDPTYMIEELNAKLVEIVRSLNLERKTKSHNLMSEKHETCDT